jgi:hypothetical protein
MRKMTGTVTAVVLVLAVAHAQEKPAETRDDKLLSQPTHLGDLFRVSKVRGERRLEAVCKLWTHNFGWEVRLEIDGDLQRSEVFRSQDDVTAGETWRAAMVEKGDAR